MTIHPLPMSLRRNGLFPLSSICLIAAPLASAPRAVADAPPRDWVAYAAPAPEDAAYLRALAADTWRCIAHFVEPATGLPYDNSHRGEFTSVTNIGYYVASCAVAAELKLVDHDEAVRRAQRVLDAYSRFRTWNGFSQSWNSVKTLQPSPSDTMISVLDSGNMVAGFVVAGQLLPEVQPAVQRILEKMDWNAFVDDPAERLIGGYDMKAGRLDSAWRIGDYAGDGRMAAFWAIACGAVQPQSWDRLSRETEEHYGLTILRPAWLGGGLFMQTQDGIFLDERGTPAGRSAADFAYAQMIYAHSLGLPAWGWSACNAPDGRYLGWGGLEVDVVTPHAAGMAAQFYPAKAVACLRALEKLGARPNWTEGDQPLALGFVDGVNLRTRKVADVYLPPLDQAMMFLAIANVLDDGVVQRAFQSHPTVRRGRQLIPEYAAPIDRAWLAELQRRDRAPLPAAATRQSSGPKRVVIADFTAPRTTDVPVSTWTRDAADTTASVRSEWIAGAEPISFMRFKYDVDSPHSAYGGVTFDGRGADLSGCDVLRLKARGDVRQTKLEIHVAGGSGARKIDVASPQAWTTLEIPLVDFGGMITDWTGLQRIVLVFEDGGTVPKVGQLDIAEVVLAARGQ